MCDLGKTKQIVPLGKPVLTITLIVNFQGEKREILSWQLEASSQERTILPACRIIPSLFGPQVRMRSNTERLAMKSPQS